MYTELVQKFREAQQAAADAYREVGVAEGLAFGDALSDYRATEVRSEYKAARELRDFCDRLAHVLVFLARKKFSPPAARLEIDCTTELKNALIDIDGALKAGISPDFDAFWTHLERSYGGDAGKAAAFAQAAKALINGFSIRPDSEIKRTSSAVILESRVYSEASYSRSGMRRVGYSQSWLSTLIVGLATFAAEHGFSTLSAQLAHGRLTDYEFTTREKVSYHGLDVVMFNDKWQFKFSHEIGDALSLFISEYGAEYLATRDRY